MALGMRRKSMRAAAADWPRHHPGTQRRARGSRGFSIIELLIASLFILVISLGVVPLFVQSTQSNLAGNDSTRVSNFAKSRAEEFLQLPFDSPLLAIQAGTERKFDEYYRTATPALPAEWLPGTLADADAAGDIALWTRTTTVRQYSLDDLTTPLDSAALPGEIDLKEIVVAVASARNPGPLSAGKSLSVRVFKSE